MAQESRQTTQTEINNPETDTLDTNPETNNGLRSIRDIVRDLSKPVAKRHLRTRKQGGKEIQYIAWHDAVKYLDHYAPGWCYEVRSIDSIAGKLILTIRLSIPCLEGIVYREATGQEDETLDAYGDSSSNSESMALRRACAKFGLGLSLYNQ
ncbi:MAG TPA: Rad52/Rad22 family DNA repair protein [Pyrinomonadaceae bacterium]|nr:Rad52/Rad22 family DNA repair protein [Pyrinomonadaceae bacterium]